MPLVIAQWLLFGYSLAFSSTANNGFIGDLGNMGLRNVLSDPSPGSPSSTELLYSFYQWSSHVYGRNPCGSHSRTRKDLSHDGSDSFWTTLVLLPPGILGVGANGWAFKWGVLDFAGK